MQVAIINQTAPVGVKPVREIIDAVAENVAVTLFVNRFDPPLAPADWLGFDTGWSVVQPPDPGKFWGYDFDAPGLVQVTRGERFEVCQVVQVIGRGPVVLTQNAAFELAAGAPFAIRDLCADVPRAAIRVRGQYQAAGADPELRLAAPSGPVSAAAAMAAAAPWTPFTLRTNVPLDGAPNLYRLQGRLNGGTQLDLRFVNLEVLSKL